MPSPKAYALSEGAARWLKTQIANQSLFEGDSFAERFAGEDSRKTYFVNESAENILPFSVVELTQNTYATDRTLVGAKKPSSVLGYYAINSGSIVEPGQVGSCQVGPIYVVRSATVSLSLNKPAGVNGWEVDILPTGKPFLDIRPIGVFDTANKYLAAEIYNLERIFIKAPSGGISGRVGSLLGSASCDLLTVSSSTFAVSNTSSKATVYNWATAAACTKGDRYGVAIKINNIWMITAEDCNDTGSTVQPGTGSVGGGEVVGLIDTAIYPSSTTVISREMKFTGSATGGGIS